MTDIDQQTKHSGDNPLDEFSGCHKGIVKNFENLKTLAHLVHSNRHDPEVIRTARDILNFFHKVVLVHHAEEEQELFKAVMECVEHEDQAKLAHTCIKQLTDEHRKLEAMWKVIEGDIRSLAAGKEATLDLEFIELFVRKYLAHAEFEEREFLPLSASILSKIDLAALGLSLHMRHRHESLPYI